MRKRIALYCAAAMAVGGLTYVTAPAGADDVRAGAEIRAGEAGQQQRAELPQGAKQAQQTDRQGITDAIAKATSAATSANQWDQFAACLAPQDRQRFQQAKGDHRQLTQAIEQFKQKWQQKYNKPLDVSANQQQVFGENYQGFEVVQGEITNPALMTNWPVEPTSGQEQRPQQERERMQPGQPRPGGAAQGNEGNILQRQDRNAGAPAKAGGAQVNAGDNIAIASFPAAHGMPALRVSLVRERQAGDQKAAAAGASQWKIDIPDNVSADQLQQSLAQHLTQLSQQADQLPEDPTEAYRMLTHHVFMAAYDVKAQQPGQQPGMQPGARPGQPQPGAPDRGGMDRR